MIDETIQKLRAALGESETISDERRAELLGLLDELETEAKDDSGANDSGDLKNALVALTAIEESARNLEATHSRSAELVRNLCHVLGRMGI
jgi:hypothetical protein